jgi:hypothetical protein
VVLSDALGQCLWELPEAARVGALEAACGPAFEGKFISASVSVWCSHGVVVLVQTAQMGGAMSPPPTARLACAVNVLEALLRSVSDHHMRPVRSLLVRIPARESDPWHSIRPLCC